MSETNDNAPPESNEPSKSQQEIILARRIFYAGCLGLPWLWICNVMYFRRKVFGPSVGFDYWPGKREEYLASLPEGEEGERRGGVMSLQERNELGKWVRRSTMGAFVMVSLFVAWIVTFQVNRESFGSNWLVMDKTEEESTGW
ncbi:hypothetical protein HJC23_013614 [Cyclotella cryptica]|uniref:Gamma-secretase subunit PEN-2 n=1 Tax=Cyclotella cryptica TaxID=29204 RepID=A0ABD3PPK1_9STRA|eukprot:CCRYP_012595-RA/>CCRYP_012595-RA protein AED:0.33 eAED:0.33 QI:0/-1/0/1/-1/1/1/0/142